MKAQFIAICLIVGAFALHSFAEHETRTWASRKGAKLEAKYIKSDKGQVTLQKADGNYVRIRENGLSGNDREYIAMIKKKEKEEENVRAAKENLEKLGLKFGQQVVALPDSVAKNKKVVSKDYLLYLPKGYGVPGEKWPLLLFLHGMGERGPGINKVSKHGPPKIVKKKDLPFVVVSPQCQAESFWGGPEIVEFVEHIESTYEIDRKRLYITGLSMGGFGTWNAIANNPDKFAAAIPICGGATSEKRKAEGLKKMPIWSFHGDADTVVAMEKQMEMVNNLKELKNKNFKFTVYKGCKHDSWTRTYNNDEIYDWLLQFSK